MIDNLFLRASKHADKLARIFDKYDATHWRLEPRPVIQGLNNRGDTVSMGYGGLEVSMWIEGYKITLPIVTREFNMVFAIDDRLRELNT